MIFVGRCGIAQYSASSLRSLLDREQDWKTRVGNL